MKLSIWSSYYMDLKAIHYQGLFNLEIPGERRVPLPLRDAKIQYVKAAFGYLMNL